MTIERNDENRLVLKKPLKQDGKQVYLSEAKAMKHFLNFQEKMR